jgi:hypothetical protein
VHCVTDEPQPLRRHRLFFSINACTDNATALQSANDGGQSALTTVLDKHPMRVLSATIAGSSAEVKSTAKIGERDDFQMPGCPLIERRRSRTDVTSVASNTATTWPRVTRIER